jgi:hypothetical protein
MKTLLPVLLALAAGCVTVPASRGTGSEEKRMESSAERDQRELAQEYFMKMHKAWLDGDALTSLYMMSVQGISDWLLTRTRDKSDPDWAKQVAKLDAARKVDFDAWARYNKAVQIPISDKRSEILPVSILNSTWLRDTWAHYFAAEKENLHQIAASLTVRDEDVYVEGPGMSVLVRVNKTPTHIYSMVLENGQWKFDYVVRPASKVTK